MRWTLEQLLFAAGGEEGDTAEARRVLIGDGITVRLWSCASPVGLYHGECQVAEQLR